MQGQNLNGSWSGSSKNLCTLVLQVSSVANINANTSTVNYSLLAYRNSAYLGTYKLNTQVSVTIDGQTDTANINFDIRNTTVGNFLIVKSGSFNIEHNSDGTKTVNCSASINLSGTTLGVGTVNGNYTLDTIMRYANTNLWSTDVGLDYATFQFNVDVPYDDVFVYVYNESNIVVQKFNISDRNLFEVTSLSPNNKYNVEVDVRRKGTELYKKSNRISFVTKTIPIITNNINFTLGNQIPLSISNPSGCLITLSLKVNNNNIWQQYIGNVHNYNIKLNENQISNMAKLLTNGTVGTYLIELKVSSPSQVYTSSINGKYYINTNDNIPIVYASSISYSDINNVANGNIIQSKSSLRVIIAGGSGTGKNGATIKTWTVNFNGVTKSSNYSSGDINFDFGIPSTSGTFNISFTATDSRGLTSSAVIKPITVHPYGNPFLNVSLSRVNGYEANVTLSINAKVITSSGFSNSIKTCSCTRSDNIIKNVPNAIGKTSYITSINSFDTPEIEKSYNYTFTLTDQLDSKVTVTVFIGEGRPALIIAENGTVGIGSYVDDGYKCQIGGDLRVDGSIYINSNTLKKHAWNNPVNSITSTDTTLSLAASAGKVLGDKFNELNNDLNNNYYIKTQVDTKFMPKSGGTFTGNIFCNGNISTKQNLKVATSQKVIWDTTANIFSNNNQHLYFMGSNEANYTAHLGVHDGMWTFDPDANENLQLGSPNHKWNTLYAKNGTIQTSDRNNKKDINKIDKRYFDFFARLNPISYRFKDGQRVHIGFISQEVETALIDSGLNSLEFAGFCKDNKTKKVQKTKKINTVNETGNKVIKDMVYFDDEIVEGEFIYSLRYDEFIALNTAVIQELLSRITRLEKNIIH